MRENRGVGVFWSLDLLALESNAMERGGTIAWFKFLSDAQISIILVYSVRSSLGDTGLTFYAGM